MLVRNELTKCKETISFHFAYCAWSPCRICVKNCVQTKTRHASRFVILWPKQCTVSLWFRFIFFSTIYTAGMKGFGLYVKLRMQIGNYLSSALYPICIYIVSECNAPEQWRPHTSQKYIIIFYHYKPDNCSHTLWKTHWILCWSLFWRSLSDYATCS